MKVDEIIRRCTGISTPIFGVSWDPPESERSIARRVIAYLEDRRVLFAPDTAELPYHCVESVIEIRKFLTDEIGKLDSGTELSKRLASMRAACRKFLDRIGAADKQGEVMRYGGIHGNWANLLFTDALGQMRGVFGVHILMIAGNYGLEIESDLARIIPEGDEE